MSEYDWDDLLASFPTDVPTSRSPHIRRPRSATVSVEIMVSTPCLLSNDTLLRLMNQRLARRCATCGGCARFSRWRGRGKCARNGWGLL